MMTGTHCFGPTTDLGEERAQVHRPLSFVLALQLRYPFLLFLFTMPCSHLQRPFLVRDPR
jgi:hypothetical protein